MDIDKMLFHEENKIKIVIKWKKGIFLTTFISLISKWRNILWNSIFKRVPRNQLKN